MAGPTYPGMSWESQDIPLGFNGRSSSLNVPGVPRTTRLAAPGVLSILGCPGRSQDILLSHTEQSPSPKNPGMSREIPGHPAWPHRAKFQSYISWDVPGNPRTSRLAAPGKVPVPSILGCPGRSQDIPLGCTGQSPSPKYPGVSWDVPGNPRTSRLAAPGKVPVLSILGCPGRSKDIPLGCTGQSPSPKYPGMSREIPGHPAWLQVPVLSILGCPGRSQDIPLGCKSQS